MLRKALIGGALAIVAMTGGAIGSSFLGVASAQTDDATTTTAPPSADDTTKDHEDCPEKDRAAAASDSATAS